MEMPSLEMVLFGAKLLVWKIDIFMCLMLRLASPICMRFVRFMKVTFQGDQIPIVLSRFLSLGISTIGLFKATRNCL